MAAPRVNPSHQATVCGKVYKATPTTKTVKVGDNPCDIAQKTYVTSGLAAVLERSCRDCHSNETVWPGYTRIAPVSWLMAYGVTKGRKAVNFSEWAAYPPERQRKLLAESCQDVTAGKMPGPYTLLHPETRLSAQDIETICAAARVGKE